MAILYEFDCELPSGHRTTLHRSPGCQSVDVLRDGIRIADDPTNIKVGDTVYVRSQAADTRAVVRSIWLNDETGECKQLEATRRVITGTTDDGTRVELDVESNTQVYIIPDRNNQASGRYVSAASVPPDTVVWHAARQVYFITSSKLLLAS